MMEDMDFQELAVVLKIKIKISTSGNFLHVTTHLHVTGTSLHWKNGSPVNPSGQVHVGM